MQIKCHESCSEISLGLFVTSRPQYARFLKISLLCFCGSTASIQTDGPSTQLKQQETAEPRFSQVHQGPTNWGLAWEASWFEATISWPIQVCEEAKNSGPDQPPTELLLERRVATWLNPGWCLVRWGTRESWLLPFKKKKKTNPHH